MHFGFSYIGFIYLLMLFIPNILWAKHKPKDYDNYAVNETKWQLTFERVGQMLVCCFALIFSDFNIRKWSLWSVWLLLSFLFMLLYEYSWVRYFRSEKTMKDFYRRLWGIAVPGATLPVWAFFLLGLYGCNVPLMIAAIILGIGHIGIHKAHYREISGPKQTPKFLKILRWVLRVLAAAVLLVVVTIVGLRNVTQVTHGIDTQNGVEEGVFVPLGGQEQYLLIRGENAENPVILWLHGGPASPDGFISYDFAKYLVEDYTLVCWDQRGGGRTWFKNQQSDPSNQTASFERVQQDLDELVDYLCARFETEQVILVGHSYGTLLGSRYALEHPEKVSAYIGVGQVVTLESEVYSYEDALTKAQANGDDTTAMEAAYATFLSDKSIFNILQLRSYVNPYHPVPKEDNTLMLGLKSPYMGVDDFRWFCKQLESTKAFLDLNQQLFDYLLTVDVYDYGSKYQVPVGFISGAEDWTTPVKYAEDYYNTIQAPAKQFFQMEGCGHAPQIDDPEEFCRILKDMLEEYLK